ncbi:MAG TPA: DCC1-like thiol-disulfide oxidoreductase family protein [Bacteroidales bacterium]|nr:DCC1-like thiol-disulfide oxidoreductase family protein [Bacteroidales bacterium]
MTGNNNIIFFDGVCNLCNALVRFIIKIDKKKLIRFSPLQSAPARERLSEFGIDGNKASSVIYISGNKAYFKSEAILRLFHDTGGIWRSAGIFRIIPRFLRDALYDVIAKNRYRVFGRKDKCMVPTPDVRSRFLE